MKNRLGGLSLACLPALLAGKRVAYQEGTAFIALVNETGPAGLRAEARTVLVNEHYASLRGGTGTPVPGNDSVNVVEVLPIGSAQ